MEDIEHENLQQAILDYLRTRFDEIEDDLAVSYQEKYAHLEDVISQAVDKEELKVAFERWYLEHQEDLEILEDIDDLWEQALVHHDLK